MFFLKKKKDLTDVEPWGTVFIILSTWDGKQIYILGKNPSCSSQFRTSMKETRKLVYLKTFLYVHIDVTITILITNMYRIINLATKLIILLKMSHYITSLQLIFN